MKITIEDFDEVEKQNGGIFIPAIDMAFDTDDFLFSFNADAYQLETMHYSIEIPERIWEDVVG